MVLSGTASDGTSGLEAIKIEGGITFAQDSTAQHDGMPKSAIESGCVDYILPPVGIAEEIARISRHPHASIGAGLPEPDTQPYLAHSPGKASLNLLKMLREGLLVAVRSAILRAGKEEATVRGEGLRVKSNGGYREVAIEVIPVGSGEWRY